MAKLFTGLSSDLAVFTVWPRIRVAGNTPRGSARNVIWVQIEFDDAGRGVRG